MRYLIASFLFGLLLLGCDSAGSRTTGPSLNCILNQGDTGSKGATSSVGDTTQNCGPNRTSDSHNTVPATE